MPKQLRVKSNYKHRDIATAIAICRCETGDTVAVHAKDGSIEYEIKADEVVELKARMRKELAKSDTGGGK